MTQQKLKGKKLQKIARKFEENVKLFQILMKYGSRRNTSCIMILRLRALFSNARVRLGLRYLYAKMSAKEPELLVVDTDGGGDDAVAIFLALSDKNIAKILAITCCFGNTSLDNVCANVKRILTICKEDSIPIHRGCEGPIIKSINSTQVFGMDGLGNVAHEFSTGDLKESEVPASLALIQLAKKHPKKINLVAIGPLTNIAIAHRIDPNFTGNLKSIVCLGGNYRGIGNTSEVAEFNFHCDPESAHILLSEVTCPVTLVPWETVLQSGIPWDVYEKLIEVQTTKGQFVKRINEFYVEKSKKKGNKKYFDCDLLAVAALMYPKCITSSIVQSAVVECGGTYCRGQVILLRDTNAQAATQPKINILTAFDEDILNKLRFQMIQD